MEVTESNKQEAEKVVERYKTIVVGKSIDSDNKLFKELAIINRQSVLDENKSVLEMLALHGDLRTHLPIKVRITNVTEQINYLQSKL